MAPIRVIAPSCKAPSIARVSTSAMSGAAQLLDDGLRQVFVDLVMPRHRLGLLGVGVGLPIVTRAVAYQSAAQRFELLDQFAPIHSRDQEFFHLADVRHFARLDVNQKILQVFSQLNLGRSLRLISRSGSLRRTSRRAKM